MRQLCLIAFVGVFAVAVPAASSASKTGTVTVRVVADAVVQGAIVSTPIAGVSIYDGDWHAVQAMGTTDAGGNYVATLSEGAHQIAVMMMTSSHSLLQSVGNPVTVTSTPTTLVIHVAPTTVDIMTRYDAGYGNALYITGETDYLGDWKVAYKLAYDDYRGWDSMQNLPLGAQFKLILAPWVDGTSIPTSAPGVRWEEGDNHVIPPPFQNYASVIDVSPTFERFRANYGSMYLRTSFNDWGALPMTLVKDHVWQGQVTAPVNTQGTFKLDLDGNWVTSWGRPSGADLRSYTNAGTAVMTQAPDNLGLYFEDHSGASQITAAIRFDDATLEFAYCPAPGVPLVFNAALCQ
jgi:hypothetical protein